MSRFYFNPAADRWAVAQIANLTSHQSYLALHLLGLVSSTKAEHRKLSLRRIAREQGHIDRFVVEVKAALVATRLLVEQKRNGGTSTYSLGPAVDGPDYQLLLEQHAQRTGTNKTKGGAVPQTAVGAVPQTAGVLSGRQQGAIPQTAHIESIESIHGEFLLKAAAEQPSAEVEPQASGLTASSPAEIPEQPTAEQPEESTKENYATEWQQKKYQQLKEKQAQHELITVEPDHPVDSKEDHFPVELIDSLLNVVVDCIEPDGCYSLGVIAEISMSEQRIEAIVWDDESSSFVELGQSATINVAANRWHGWSLFKENHQHFTLDQLTTHMVSLTQDSVTSDVDPVLDGLDQHAAISA